MSWIGVLLATIGATLILSALAFVSTLVGVLDQSDDRPGERPADRPPARAPGQGPSRVSYSSASAPGSGVVADRIAAS